MAGEIIGPKIKEIRKQKGLTQEQLAKALGYSGKSVISHIEKGDADMTYEKMLLLLRTFDLDANQIFDGKKTIKPVKVKEDNKKDLKEPKRIIIYIHGLHGSAKEAKEYVHIKGYDIKGLEYKDGNPWEVGPFIKDKFTSLIKHYDEVYVVANSIGAFYAFEYLSDFKIKKAFFISPIVSMFQNIVDLMTMYGITDKQFEKKKIIELDDGTVLSYDFYQHVSNEEDHWKVPTEILYGAYDEVVYTGSMMEFLENHPLARLTVKSDAEHYFSSGEEKRFIQNWIKRGLKQPMASSRDYLIYVTEDLLRDIPNVTYKKMMGEYILYKDTIIFGGIYDDRFLVKKTKSVENLELKEVIPYPNAKPMLLIDIEDSDEVNEIITNIVKDLTNKSQPPNMVVFLYERV